MNVCYVRYISSTNNDNNSSLLYFLNFVDAKKIVFEVPSISILITQWIHWMDELLDMELEVSYVLNTEGLPLSS